MNAKRLLALFGAMLMCASLAILPACGDSGSGGGDDENNSSSNNSTANNNPSNNNPENNSTGNNNPENNSTGNNNPENNNPPAPACTRAGATCTEDTPSTANFVCAATDSLDQEALTCHATCADDIDCPSGSFCAELTDGTSICVPGNCDSYFDSASCADAGPNGGTCAAFSNDTFYCIPAGATAQGGSCAADDECGSGLACIFGTCQPFCSLNNDSQACPGDLGCLPLLDSATVGICGDSCPGFASTDECGEGMGCLPLTGGEDSIGFCVEVGEIAANEECDGDAEEVQCAAGSSCVALSETQPAVCAPYCDLTAEDPNAACGEGQVCITAFEISDDLGICVDGCDPQAEENQCTEPGLENCLPLRSTAGICLDSGDKALGAACNLIDESLFGDCAGGSICLPDDFEDESPTAPGTCAATCLTFSSVNDYESGCDAGQVCEIFGTAWGACTDAVADPPLGPFEPCGEPGTWCSNDNICITVDNQGNSLCIPLCRLGDPEGNDCEGIELQGTPTSCDVLFDSDSLGACIPQQ